MGRLPEMIYPLVWTSEGQFPWAAFGRINSRPSVRRRLASRREHYKPWAERLLRRLEWIGPGLLAHGFNPMGPTLCNGF